MRPAFILALLASGFTATFAAEDQKPDTAAGDRWHATYFRQRVEAIEDASLKGIDTREQWEARREKDREALFDMLGLFPRPEKSDLKATVTGKLEREKFTVEKIQFQSRPQLYVTGDLYLPKNLDKPAPTILYLCGHGAVKKDGVSYGNKVYYQHHGAWFAEHGYVCFIIDSLELGEIEGLHHGTYRENMWWWNALGYSPAGVEAWNCIRALDYLETRPEVDRERMGATGRSGGGAYTWWVAALDDRIKAAAPVAGITDLRNHVIDGTVEGHCDCMFFSNSYRWDYANVAALVAPRPLLIANSDSDRIFPLDGVLRIHEKTRKIYQLYDAADKIGLQISTGPHKDTQELQMAVFKFFDKHLRGEERVIERAATKQFEPEELKVFDKLPADQRNATIHETFNQRFAMRDAPSASMTWESLRSTWERALREKVFSYWPSQPDATSVPPRVVSSTAQDNFRLTVYEFTVHDGLTLPLLHIGLDSRKKPADVELFVTGDPEWGRMLAALGGKFGDALEAYHPPAADEAALAELVRRLEKADLFVVAPRNIGPTATNPASKAQTQLRRRYTLLGESLEGMQAWDVKRAIESIRMLSDLADARMHVRAEGELAAVALYASLEVSPSPHLELVAPPASHRTSSPFFHVLRYIDMPQAVAIAAERATVKLVHVNEDDWSFPIETAKNQKWHDRLTIVNEQAAAGK